MVFNYLTYSIKGRFSDKLVYRNLIRGGLFMAIIYNCRHCGSEIGRLNQRFIDTLQLGWNHLSLEDRKKMIHYEPNGDVSIQSICEDCQETLGRYPEYHELDFFIH